MNSPVSLFRPVQANAIDAYASESLGLSGYELMGRAGASAWALLHKRWPKASRIVVVCGPGNNGGDGYMLARSAKAAGCDVQVLTPPEASAASKDGKRAADAWREAGGITRVFDGVLPAADLWVDALYGTGLSRPVAGAVHERIDVALDVAVERVGRADHEDGGDHEDDRPRDACEHHPVTGQRCDCIH